MGQKNLCNVDPDQMPENMASDQGLHFAIHPAGFSHNDRWYRLFQILAKEKETVKVSQYLYSILDFSMIVCVIATQCLYAFFNCRENSLIFNVYQLIIIIQHVSFLDTTCI